MLHSELVCILEFRLLCYAICIIIYVLKNGRKDLMGKFKEILASNDYVILDGALGTELENRGYDVSGKLWSAKYLLENPQVIQDLHEDYLQSGADIVTTSSYQATVQGLKDFGLSEAEALKTIALTVDLAKNARDNFWQSLSDDEKEKRQYPLIAGDVGPYAAYLADGSEYTEIIGCLKKLSKTFIAHVFKRCLQQVVIFWLSKRFQM